MNEVTVKTNHFAFKRKELIRFKIIVNEEIVKRGFYILVFGSLRFITGDEIAVKNKLNKFLKMKELRNICFENK